MSSCPDRMSSCPDHVSQQERAIPEVGHMWAGREDMRAGTANMRSGRGDMRSRHGDMRSGHGNTLRARRGRVPVGERARFLGQSQVASRGWHTTTDRDQEDLVKRIAIWVAATLTVLALVIGYQLSDTSADVAPKDEGTENTETAKPGEEAK